MFESTPVYPSPAPYWMMTILGPREGFLKLAGYTALSTRLDEMLEVEWTFALSSTTTKCYASSTNSVLSQTALNGIVDVSTVCGAYDPACAPGTLRDLRRSSRSRPRPRQRIARGSRSPCCAVVVRRASAPPFLAESSQGEKVLLNWKAEVSVSQDFPGSAIHMVNDNAEVFEVGQKMPDDALDVIGGHTRHPNVALHHRLDQLVADRTTFFPRREVPSHTHENYGATMDVSTEDPGFHDLGWITCSLTIADPSVVTLHTASSAPSRPSSRIHCVHGGVGGAYTVKVRLILVDCVRDRLKPLSVTIKLPTHAFSAHDDGVDGATTCGPRVGVDVLDVEARVLSAEGLEHAWGGAGTPGLS
ncbi:hypothetical protein B0H14DRAFT_3861042 [Mycena olivaceomarginata]|nr:hypothetical protein B0H14DRAFT_3861042 [Mycena olivaceomarginata]